MDESHSLASDDSSINNKSEAADAYKITACTVTAFGIVQGKMSHLKKEIQSAFQIMTKEDARVLEIPMTQMPIPYEGWKPRELSTMLDEFSEIEYDEAGFVARPLRGTAAEIKLAKKGAIDLISDLELVIAPASEFLPANSLLLKATLNEAKIAAITSKDLSIISRTLQEKVNALCHSNQLTRELRLEERAVSIAHLNVKTSDHAISKIQIYVDKIRYPERTFSKTEESHKVSESFKVLYNSLPLISQWLPMRPVSFLALMRNLVIVTGELEADLSGRLRQSFFVTMSSVDALKNALEWAPLYPLMPNSYADILSLRINPIVYLQCLRIIQEKEIGEMYYLQTEIEKLTSQRASASTSVNGSIEQTIQLENKRFDDFAQLGLRIEEKLTKLLLLRRHIEKPLEFLSKPSPVQELGEYTIHIQDERLIANSPFFYTQFMLRKVVGASKPGQLERTWYITSEHLSSLELGLSSLREIALAYERRFAQMANTHLSRSMASYSRYQFALSLVLGVFTSALVFLTILSMLVLEGITGNVLANDMVITGILILAVWMVVIFYIIRQLHGGKK